MNKWACFGISSLLVFWATSTAAASDLETNKMRYRSEVMKELEAAETAFESAANDQEVRKQYATLLFQTGDFWKAKEILTPLTESAETAADLDVLKLSARLAYLTGDYQSAERLYSRIMKLAEKGSEAHKDAASGLGHIYFQTHQYGRAAQIPEAGEFEPFLDMMRKFPGRPYQLEWRGQEKIAALPFEIKGMLPTMKVAVNGRELEFILDTGGNLFYIDRGVAAECGLQKLVTKKAKYAYTGGEEVEEFLGRADEVKLGEVTLKNVPFIIAEWKSRGIQSDGVLTTQALKEFLATVDYANSRILLRERSDRGKEQFKASVAGKETAIAEMPFVLDGTHLMFAGGSLNGRDGLTFLVDSGLAASVPFVGMDGMIEDMGLKLSDIPGMKYKLFNISTLGMGGLLLDKPTQGLAGVMVEENPYWSQGFIWDGLISHQFLKNFKSWTLDFDSMTYIFEK